MAKVVYGPEVFHDAGNCREMIFGRVWSKPPIIFIICDICRGLMGRGLIGVLPVAEVAGALMKVKGPAAAAASATVSAGCFSDWAAGLPVPEAGFKIALDCPSTESTSSAGME